MKKGTAKRKADIIVILVSVAVLALAGILWFMDPSGGLFKTVVVYSIFVIVGALGLVCLYGLFILMRAIWAGISYKLSEGAREQHPQFYEEMRSMLSAILRPLGFDFQDQENGFATDTKFVMGEFSVLLSWDVRDEMYYVSASSKPEAAEQFDFVVTCRSLRKAEKYKSETREKLNEWLKEKNLNHMPGAFVHE